MSPPKDRTAGAVAGSVGVWLEKCLPPTPVAITRQMRAGIQEYFSYLDGLRQSLSSIVGRWYPQVENLVAHKRQD